MQAKLNFILLSMLTAVVCDKKAASELNLIKDFKVKPDKSNEFLKKIKEDLRRNNDDYAEAMARNTTAYPQTIPNNLNFHYKKEKANTTYDFKKRRAYESLIEEENFTDSKDIEFTSMKTLIRLFTKITQTTTPKIESKLNNMTKLKLFFEKNNDLVKQFIGNKAMGSLNMYDKAKQNIRMKAQENDQQIVLPNSEQLDMAPAKGSRIHMLRLKGRLCQRNVLIPEGPKYDSKGNIYLPAFSSAPRHIRFEKTKPPKIILPRCCNCCKKSVLGCE